jgi:hypothetical protein
VVPLRTDPIIVTGAGHSGTRGLITILGAADGVYLGDTNNQFREWEFYRRLAGKVNAWLLGLPDVHDHNVIPPDVVRSFRAAPAQVAEGAERIRAAIAEQPDASQPPDGHVPWVFKTPRTNMCLEIWHAVFPDARFVNLVRDGRDVAVAKQSPPAGSVQRRFELWRARVNRLWEYQRRGLPIVDLRYEDLPDPEKLGAFCDSVGLPYSPRLHGGLVMHSGHGAELMKSMPYERFELMRLGYDPHFEHLAAVG